MDHTGAPTIVLAKTIKGYGLGEAGEGKNITHQQKKLNDDELEMFRSRFGIPIPDDELHKAPFYRPSDDSAEIKYMQARRQQLGGYMPQRKVRSAPMSLFPESHFEEFHKGTEGREVSTTMVFVRLLAKLLRDLVVLLGVTTDYLNIDRRREPGIKNLANDIRRLYEKRIVRVFRYQLPTDLFYVVPGGTMLLLVERHQDLSVGRTDRSSVTQSQI